jgi:hypothetical protein
MRFFLAFLILVLSSTFVFANQEVDSLIGVLENTMLKRAAFDQQKENRILELKRLLNKKDLSKNQEFFINHQLIDAYSKYSLDSAISYLQLNIQLAQELQNRELLDQTNIMMADLMATTGKYFDAIDILNQIENVSIAESQKIPYYNAMIKVYSELSFHSPFTDFNQKYSNKVKTYTDSVMPYLDPQSENYLSILEKKYRDEGNLSESLTINTRRLSKTKIGNKAFSLIAYERALLYRMGENDEERTKYLCLSAISDIMSSN